MLCGVRPSVGEASGRSGYRASARHKEQAYGILRNAGYKESVRCSFHSDRCVGRPQVGRIGVEVEGVMRVARGELQIRAAPWIGRGAVPLA